MVLLAACSDTGSSRPEPGPSPLEVMKAGGDVSSISVNKIVRPSGPRMRFVRDVPVGSLIASTRERAQGATTPASIAALRYAAKYAGVHADAFASAYVALVHDLGRGPIVVRLQQRVGGKEVADTSYSVTMDQQLDLVAVAGELVDAARPTPELLAAKTATTSTEAIARAMDDTGVGRTVFMSPAIRKHGWDTMRSPILAHPARARQVLFPVDGRLVLAWETEIHVRGGKSGQRMLGFRHVISDDGELLARKRLSFSDAAFSYRVWADATGDKRPQDGPQGDYTPHPTGLPDGFDPAFVAPSLVTIDGFNHAPGGGHDSWLAPGATTTFGNNVEAYADLDNFDGFSGGDVTPDVTAPGVFDRAYDVHQDPQETNEQTKAAVTDQFYVTNWLHDYWYDSGFNEAAGNGQKKNFGRGGIEGDPLQAQGQDSSGEDNANMDPGLDGTPPVMQMFVFNASSESGTTPDGLRRDGTIDNHVIEHEWGHYLHLRLEPTCSGNQCFGMSEGWGDFDSLLTSVREGDDLNGAFGMGGYVSREFTANAALFGIRRYPYSNDLTKSPLTLRFVQSGVDLPAGVPTSDTFFLQGGDNFEVHNQGEIWAASMWDAAVAMLKDSQGATPRFTFEEGRRRVADYVVAGLIGAPPDPTYTEQRDAVLAAAVAGDAQDFATMSIGFAHRGLGTNAVAPDRNSFSGAGVVEDFNVGGKLFSVPGPLVEDSPSCDGDGILDAGETATMHIVVKNIGAGGLTAPVVDVSSPTAGIGFPNGSHIALSAIPSFGETTADVKVSLSEQSVNPTAVTVHVALSDPSGAKQSFDLSIPANVDVVANATTADFFEEPGLPAWSVSSAWTNEATDLTNHAAEVAVQVNGDHTLQSPVMHVGAGADLVVSFSHRYSFQTVAGGLADGGVIEVSTDGVHFQDVEAVANPGYDGVISGSGNVLAGRDGFGGRSAGFPAFEDVSLDLGTGFGGKDVTLRFRAAGDDTSGASTWDVDNVAVQGITTKPFPSFVLDTDNTCLPGSRPVADAGTNQTLAAGDPGALDGTASEDPDGGALSFEWTQISGVIIPLSDAHAAQPTFTAPNVTHDVTTNWQLVVTDPDARVSAPSTVKVVITGTAPPVDAGVPDAAIDASVPPDAFVGDAGVDPIDGSVPPDSGLNPDTGDGGGCCSAGGDARGGLLLGLGVGAMLVRRRRR